MLRCVGYSYLKIYLQERTAAILHIYNLFLAFPCLISPPFHLFHIDLSQQTVDERQDLSSILVGILLMGVGIVSIAAVRISGVAVALDDGGVLSALVS
jgi:hypothetical protein